VCAVVAAVAISIPQLLRLTLDAQPSQLPRRYQDAYCTATLPKSTMGSMLSPEQAQNAAEIVLIAVRRGLPDRAAEVAITTAMQESKLTNLSYGDRDSVGLFQQRPSQGWGSREQLMDEAYATNAFYNALLTVRGWQALPIAVAAQKVQRSGYPDRYALWNDTAISWSAALMGTTPAAATCLLEPAGPANAVEFSAAFSAAFPEITIMRENGEDASAAASSGAHGTTNNEKGNEDGHATQTFELKPFGANARTNIDRLRWQAATWLIMHARPYGIDSIRVDDKIWTRQSGKWLHARQWLHKQGDASAMTVAIK
jgi:hypothetical protein